MKKVWKCDFCRKTDEDFLVIKKHEEECYMNPAIKDCGSCKNYEQVDYSQSYACVYGMAFEEEKIIPCNKWESDNR